jgi:hypothetical protein
MMDTTIWPDDEQAKRLAWSCKPNAAKVLGRLGPLARKALPALRRDPSGRGGGSELRI